MGMRMYHTGRVVRDIDSLVPFYRDVVGLKDVRYAERKGPAVAQALGYENAHLKVAFLSSGDGHFLEIVQYLNPSPSDRVPRERNLMSASHLAFFVDDIQQTYDELIEGGATKLNPPAEIAPSRRICYMQDPEGNWIELVETTE